MGTLKRNLILTDGGMGDLICELVAVDYCIKNNPIKFQVWVPDYLHKYAIHVLPPKTNVIPFSLAKKHFDGTIKGRTTQWFEHGHTPMRTHPVDYGFHMLADKHIYDLSLKNYLKIRPKAVYLKHFKLPSNYVCIVTTAAEPVKAMKEEVLTQIIDYVKEKGYNPVFLGKEKAHTGYKDFQVTADILKVDYHKGINLVNQTDMLQAAAVIAGSKAIIGMDGGLIHLAGSTDAPIIAGYTLVAPDHVLPIRGGIRGFKCHPVVPPEHIPNRFFQTNNTFYEGDYRVFPGWKAVRDSLTFNLFKNEIDKVL